MNKVRIITHDSKTEIYLNGVSASKRCTGYSLVQEGGEAPVLTVELICDDVDISVDGVKAQLNSRTRTNNRHL